MIRSPGIPYIFLPQDPRKSRGINEAKSRLEPLFHKLQNGELSAGAESGLLDLTNGKLVPPSARPQSKRDAHAQFVFSHAALERGDKATAGKLHKDVAGKFWEELSSPVMIGMKRLIDAL